MEMAERVLLETLAMLGERELQRFKDKLSEIQPKEGYQHLLSGSLRNADPPALTDLLLLFYGTDYGAEVAAEALRAIGQGALAERIERLIEALRREKHYFEWQQKQLKQLRYVRIPLLPRKNTLNDEQYQTIRAEKTSQEKMRKLYELVPGWNKWQKDRLYQALKRTNRDLVEELKGGHFVDWHREQLIQRVSEVDGVLKLLRGHTLTPEQYQSISTGRSNVEKMQKLYELVPSWGREHKDWLYRVLWITNRALVDEFAGVGTRVQKPSTSPSPGAKQEHFVERHREQLIQHASSVDTILGVLRWSHYPLDAMPPSVGLETTNKSLPEEPEASKRRTGRGGLLRNWLYILNDEQYQTIRAEKTSQEKMRKLYELVPGWDKLQKYRLYQALMETNGDLVEELEGVDTRAQKPSTSTSPGAKREHFVERHREQLIQRASSVDRILGVLRRSHYPLDAMPPSVGLKRTNKRLPEEPEGHSGHMDFPHDEIDFEELISASGACWGTDRELSVDSRDDPTTAGTSCLPPVQHDSMRNQGPVSYASKAHTVFPGEGSQVTGQAHHSLAPTGHSGHMEVLHDQISAEELTSASGFTSEETESHSSSAAGIKAAKDETSRSQSPTACLRGQHKCNWCSREEEVSDPVYRGAATLQPSYMGPDVGLPRTHEAQLQREALPLRSNYWCPKVADWPSGPTSASSRNRKLSE
nr:uncharacterized protein LOC101950806 isoform X2 [Chrysemys picta bellii]